MFFPQDVSGTHNAYHATYAAIRCALLESIDHVVLPGACTGVGKMPVKEAAAQMASAIEDALSGKPSPYTAADIRKEQPDIYFETYL